MQTVYIVAIAVAGGGILVLAWIFRSRLTALTVKFREALEIKATPNKTATNTQATPGKGAVFEDAKILGSKIRVKNSTLIFRRSLMKKGSNIDVSESSSFDRSTND
jgi:hypothetical protein